MTARLRTPGRRRSSQDSQPGLPFALPDPATPLRVALEASTPCAAPFDNDDWLFSVDWEGSRCLLSVDGGGAVRLHGETAILDDRFPEVVRGAQGSVARAAVVDGTVCVLDGEGRPDLGALCGRAATGASRPRAVFLATDLLKVDGAPLTGRPLQARLAALAELVRPAATIQVPDHVAGNGRALAGAAAQRGLAGVLARRRDAPYRAGLASPDRLRIALSTRRDAVVVGFCRRSSRLHVVLGDWDGGRLVLVGTAAVESSSVDWLTASVDATADAGVDGAAAAGAGVTWVRPRLVAAIERAAVIEARGLRAWRLVALRDDVDPMWCVRRAAVDAPPSSADVPPRAFSPTVLSALPLDGAA